MVILMGIIGVIKETKERSVDSSPRTLIHKSRNSHFLQVFSSKRKQKYNFLNYKIIYSRVMLRSSVRAEHISLRQ